MNEIIEKIVDILIPARGIKENILNRKELKILLNKFAILIKEDIREENNIKPE
jgi:hypothetical protein